jgi:hypothetical protein
LGQAVSNNVEWCARVSPGGGTVDSGTGVWLATGTPPPFFPDAVTLKAGVRAARLSSALSNRPRCSVKDSFADVDLTPYGFSPLFTARWIARVPTPADHDPTGWSCIADQDALQSWCTAAHLPRVLPTRLLGHPAVRILARRRDGVIDAGAIANRSDLVVGLSNVFQVGARDPWDSIVSALGRYFPDLPVVGYESDSALSAALQAGFGNLGPPRVWAQA